MNDTEVVVYVSEKKPGVKMPNCVGDTKDAALSKIANQFGISTSTINVVEEYSDSVSEGKVIRTHPAAETEIVDVSYQKITVYISMGPEEIPVTDELVMPEVLGYTLSEAIGILRDAGIDNSVSRKYVESSEAKNTVVRCNFNAGDTLTADDEIVFYISDASLTQEGANTESEDDSQSPEDTSENVTEDENLDDILEMRDAENQ